MRLISEYIRYYHEGRTHLGLAKDTPVGRPTAICSAANARFAPFRTHLSFHNLPEFIRYGKPSQYLSSLDRRKECWL